MLLHVPTTALQNVKKGDNVTVELALKDNGPAPTTKERSGRRTSMELFKCQQCGRKFNSQEELRKHEQECLPARVK